MKIYLSIIFACLLLGSKTFACSCLTGDPSMEFNNAKTVFIGRMIGGSEKLSYKDEKGASHAIEAGKVRFAVRTVFKGKPKQQAIIEIASMDGTSCGPYGLIPGTQYIVYGYTNKNDGETLYTGVCTRTIEVNSSYAKEDLQFLQHLPRAGSGGNLQGRIWADLRRGGATPLPNVKVNIRSPDNKLITVNTDQNGYFELKRIKAGKYRVRPQLPANYFVESEFEDVEIADRGTGGAGFEAYLNGKVSGRIADKDGRAFNSIFLHLEDAANTRVYGHATKKDGGFAVKGVPPGNYILFIELKHKDYNKNVNYYYPGTFDRQKSTVLKVGLGGKIEGLNFTLPEDFKVRTIRGQVFWDDGKPAAEADVSLLCPQSTNPNGYAVEFGAETTKADKQGRFTIEVFSGETYWIQASGEKPTGKKNESYEFYSPSKKLILTESLSDLKFVLSERGVSGGCGN